MADIDKISVKGTVYGINDSTARDAIAELEGSLTALEETVASLNTDINGSEELLDEALAEVE